MTNVLRSIRTDPAGAATLFTQSQVTGVGIGFSFCAFLFNCLPTRYFGWLTYVGGINLLVGVLATVVVLPASALRCASRGTRAHALAVSPHQRLANDVFGNFVPNVSMHDCAALMPSARHLDSLLTRSDARLRRPRQKQGLDVLHGAAARVVHHLGL